MLPENWDKLSTDERREHRLSSWADPASWGITDAAVAQKYRERAQRLIDVLNLREPDRVPRQFPAGGLVAEYAGIDHGDVMYDAARNAEATIKMCRDFDLDYQTMGEGYFVTGADKVGYKSYKWPGGQLANNQLFQAVDEEYMPAEDYDRLIADPSRYMWQTYVPTVMPELEGMRYWPNGLGIVELPFFTGNMASFALPPLRATLEKLLEVSDLAAEWIQGGGPAGPVVYGELGLPLAPALAAATKAPLDFVGDTLRGTKAIMMDVYRRPDKVRAASEAFVPLAIDLAVNAATAFNNPWVFIPLHKGADGFMRQKDFDNLYLPTYKAVLDGLIAAGCVPWSFVEGGYNSRLDALAAAGIPEKSTMWWFDQTDMAEAKKKIGSWAGIGGNVPASVLATASPAEVKEYVKKLYDVCMPGGGYFLTTGAIVDQARTENVHAYLEAGLEYGKY